MASITASHVRKGREGKLLGWLCNNPTSTCNKILMGRSGGRICVCGGGGDERGEVNIILVLSFGRVKSLSNAQFFLLSDCRGKIEFSFSESFLVHINFVLLLNKKNMRCKRALAGLDYEFGEHVFDQMLPSF